MKLAALDIGTNSVHMVRVTVGADRTLRVEGREKAPVRLGKGLFHRDG